MTLTDTTGEFLSYAEYMAYDHRGEELKIAIVREFKFGHVLIGIGSPEHELFYVTEEMTDELAAVLAKVAVRDEPGPAPAP